MTAITDEKVKNKVVKKPKNPTTIKPKADVKDIVNFKDTEDEVEVDESK